LNTFSLYSVELQCSKDGIEFLNILKEIGESFEGPRENRRKVASRIRFKVFWPETSTSLKDIWYSDEGVRKKNFVST
jgi:hypothetical protein